MTKQVRIDIPLLVLRRRAGLSQDTLAQLTGISQRSLSALETGRQQRLDLRLIARLCEVFACSPGDLFTLEGEAAEPAAPSPAAPPPTRPRERPARHHGPSLPPGLDLAALTAGKVYAQGTFGHAFQAAGLSLQEVAQALGASLFSARELADYQLPRGPSTSASLHQDLGYIANHLQLDKSKLGQLLATLRSG